MRTGPTRRSKNGMRLVVLLLLLPLCERATTVPVMADMEDADAPNQESWNVRTQVTQTLVGETASRKRLELIADYVAWYETEESRYQLLKQIMRPVVVHLYDAQGDSSATVQAREIRYYSAEDRFEATGQVVVHTRDDTRLTTDALEWRERDRTLRTDRFVRIISSKEDVQGYGLVAGEDLQTYQLGRFTARVVVEE